jgi:hypothetical protein
MYLVDLFLSKIFCVNKTFSPCEQLNAEFRENEASFQLNGEGSDFPAKVLTGIIEVCYAIR